MRTMTVQKTDAYKLTDSQKTDADGDVRVRTQKTDAYKLTDEYEMTGQKKTDAYKLMDSQKMRTR